MTFSPRREVLLMARKKKIKKYAIRNSQLNDYYKGRDKIKGYTMWSYRDIDAMMFDERNEAEFVASQLTESVEVVEVFYEE